MSIASEITSIGENLKKDYQAIANLGADLTNVDKNIENIAELLDGVYDNLPKTSYQEGTEVNLGVTSKGKLDYENGVVGIGQSSQETTTGKNLWGGFDRSTTGVVTFTNYKNGTMKVNGTNDTSGTLFSMTSAGATNYLITLEAGTYTISGGSTNVGISVVNSTGGTLASCNDTPATFTTNGVSIFVRASVNVGVSVNNETLYVQLEKNSSATAWEPYTNGASPNPSYPQTINSVTGNQDVVVKDGDNNTIATYQLSLGDIELNAIGDYKDELIYDVDEDRVYKNEKIGKYTFNNVSNLYQETIFGVNKKYFFQTISTAKNLGNPAYNFYCEILSKSNGVANDYSGFFNGTNIVVLLNDSDTTTTATEKYSGKSLLYVLATPELIELTDTTLKAQVKALYNAHSLNGTTIITSNGNLPMIIKCRGLKGE